MFIVTAQMVKPVNRDDLPRIPNVENLKNGSLLGVEPTGTGAVTGPSGFIINSGATSTPATTQPAATQKPTTPESNGEGNKTPTPAVSAVQSSDKPKTP